MTVEQALSGQAQGEARPLEGIKVVEVAMWAFVPAAGGILSDLGATVIKVEPPTGDPLRGLSIGGAHASSHGFDLSWENYNRGKTGITLDLRQERGLEVLHRLLRDTDVFLTNLLPRARRRMKIDIDDFRPLFPNLIYAVGSGAGRNGPEADRGGFDAITYWARGGIASSLMPDDESAMPVLPPGPAFGDLIGGGLLAGGIAAAIAQRAMTGHASTVDVSLLSAAMWSMQRGITQTTITGEQRLHRPTRLSISNPLVNSYRTGDGRWLALNMLQGDRYWAPFCRLIGRDDLVDDPRFADARARAKNNAACVAELDAVFARRTLLEWSDLLARQEGQWDVVRHVGEIKDDPQVAANGYMQQIEHKEGRSLAMVSSPFLFDGAPLPARRAPDVGEHSDAVLGELGYGEDEIIDLKVAGIVF